TASRAHRATAAGAADHAQAPTTGRLLVLADARAPRTAVTAAAARAGARAARPAVPQIGLLTVRPRPGESPAAPPPRIARQRGVARVEPERRMRLRELPDDLALIAPEPLAGTPASALPATTPLSWPLLREGFPAAWDVTRGEQALVAVIDTGVDAAHP